MPTLKDTYPLYLNNTAEQPNTDLEVTDKFTGEVAFRTALASPEVIDELLWRQQRGSLVEQQGVATPDRPAPGITGNDPDRTLLLSRASGRDQSSASLWTLHNDHGRGEGHQQTVSGCEVTATDRRCLRLLAQQQTPLSNGCLQPVVVAWVDPVERGPKHRDRTSACIQTGAMGGSIDAFSQTAEHRPASQHQGTTEFSCGAKTMGRCRSGSNHGDTALLGDQRQGLRTAPMEQRQGWPLQCTEERWPALITRKNGVARNAQVRRDPSAPTEAIDLLQQRLGPGERLLQPIDRPSPEFIETNAMLESHGLEHPHSCRADAGTTTPKPPPAPHDLVQMYYFNLSVHLPGQESSAA